MSELPFLVHFLCLKYAGFILHFLIFGCGLLPSKNVGKDFLFSFDQTWQQPGTRQETDVYSLCFFILQVQKPD